MPPKDAPRPAEREYDGAVAHLEKSLDSAAAKKPNPGRTETFRRLNRTEYQNTIRDLLALDVDVAQHRPELEGPMDEQKHVTNEKPVHGGHSLSAVSKSVSGNSRG